MLVETQSYLIFYASLRFFSDSEKSVIFCPFRLDQERAGIKAKGWVQGSDSRSDVRIVSLDESCMSDMWSVIPFDKPFELDACSSLDDWQLWRLVTGFLGDSRRRAMVVLSIEHPFSSNIILAPLHGITLLAGDLTVSSETFKDAAQFQVN